MQKELQSGMNDITARLAHADALHRQADGARQAAEAKVAAADRRAAEDRDKVVAAERAARISDDKLSQQAQREQHIMDEWRRDRTACTELNHRLRRRSAIFEISSKQSPVVRTELQPLPPPPVVRTELQVSAQMQPK